jgi:hypothetical protein
MRTSLWRLVTAGALVLAVAATGACGRKTDPLTPDSPRPEAVKDVKIASGISSVLADPREERRERR